MADISQRLQDEVLAARRDGRALNIVGGGSKKFMGRPVEGDKLDVSEHSGIVEYHPVELVITARAGTRLSEIEATLAENGQVLAFEPPHFTDKSTIGGTLACNQSGPGRPWTSSVRDHLLGTRLINGQGEHLRFGGQVMKNVAGYDVSRLQAGAMGTLGVITEVSLKVLPRPAATVTLVQDMALAEVVRFMNARAAEPKPLTGACWHDGRLYLRLSGARSAVDATAKQWGGDILDAGDAFWAGLRDQKMDYFGDGLPLWRFSVNPMASNPSLDGGWLIDWGGAQRWYRGEGELAQMEALAARAGGQVSLFRGGDRSGEVMHRQPAALKTIQQRIKRSFDPDAIFNPGRLYTWM